MDSSSVRPLDTLSGLGLGGHASVVHRSERERVDAVVAFLDGGLRRNERLLVVSDSGDDPPVRAALAREGGEPGWLVEQGRLAFRRTADVYLAAGAFDAERTLARWTIETSAALERGFAGLRLTATTGWVFARGCASAFVDYECRCDRIFPGLPVAALCQYERRHLDGSGRSAAVDGHAVVHDAPLLTIEASGDGVALVGEVDLSNAALVRHALGRLRPPHDTIDLSGVTFLDLTGGRAVLEQRGARVARPSRAARLVLDRLPRPRPPASPEGAG